MTFYFVDTSALVKRYHLETGSSKVAMIFTSPESMRFISRLGLVEATSAFAVKVREGLIQTTDFYAYRKRLLACAKPNAQRGPCSPTSFQASGSASAKARHDSEVENTRVQLKVGKWYSLFDRENGL